MHLSKLLKAAAAALTLVSAAATAQVRNVDPNSAIDADLAPRTTQSAPATPAPVAQDAPVDPGSDLPPPESYTQPPVDPARATAAEAAPTYQRDDLLAAAEGVFGKGAEGLAGMVERILREQGEPNAYIAGREAGGAFVVGLRYGSGVMTHRVEGNRTVYWTGPSLGFDVGGDASKVFVLVYNLYDTQDIFKRFPAGEGRVFFVGGFAASYLRRGNIVLIPIRLGVGWRLGANVGYMRFSEKAKWLPF